MKTMKNDLVIIGGGPAGLAAAIAAKEAGCCDLLLAEREGRLGGILNQCIHDGFGLHRFNEALSGPEYAARYIGRLNELRIPVALDTMVLSLNADKRMLLSSAGELWDIEAASIVLAMGCRERARGALSTPGHRPSGVYTAGTAQNLVNIENYMPGRRVCVMGSGDIGLIMARRMTLEGAKVEAVFARQGWPSGLPRNVQQCLVDYGIPLYLRTTVVDIVGMGRLEGVVVSKLDEKRQPVKGTERFIPCDTLLISGGLIPENELAHDAGITINPLTGGPMVDERCMTDAPGVFSCGNALHVHDLVDWVSEEAERAGRAAAEYVSGSGAENLDTVDIKPGSGVNYVMPNHLLTGTTGNTVLMFRVTAPARDGKIQIVLRGPDCGESILKEEKHSRLHPSEMIRVELSAEEKSQFKAGDILEVKVP